MQFQDFAKLLYPISGCKNQSDFVVRIFEAITDLDDLSEDALDIKPDTARAYYNGGTSINVIAKKLAGHIDKIKFSEYILSVTSDDSRETLATKFETYCPGVTGFNICDELGELFKRIIEDAAAPSRKGSKKLLTKQGNESEFLMKKFGTRLYIESDGICHYDNCGRPLYVTANGNKQYSYKIVKIDQNADAVVSNLIALCPNCATIHSMNQNKDEIRRLQAIKANIVLKENAKITASDTNVDSGIRNVIRKIGTLNIKEPIPLNYNPATIRQKIPDDISLSMKVLAYVSVYYEQVKNIFRDMDQEQEIQYGAFSSSVKMTYQKLKGDGLAKAQIFDSLSEWLMNATNENRGYCEIIVAYYIQNCEVYDAVTQ